MLNNISVDQTANKYIDPSSAEFSAMMARTLAYPMMGILTEHPLTAQIAAMRDYNANPDTAGGMFTFPEEKSGVITSTVTRNHGVMQRRRWVDGGNPAIDENEAKGVDTVQYSMQPRIFTMPQPYNFNGTAWNMRLTTWDIAYATYQDMKWAITSLRSEYTQARLAGRVGNGKDAGWVFFNENETQYDAGSNTDPLSAASSHPEYDFLDRDKLNAEPIDRWCPCNDGSDGGAGADDDDVAGGGPQPTLNGPVTYNAAAVTLANGVLNTESLNNILPLIQGWANPARHGGMEWKKPKVMEPNMADKRYGSAGLRMMDAGSAYAVAFLSNEQTAVLRKSEAWVTAQNSLATAKGMASGLFTGEMGDWGGIRIIRMAKNVEFRAGPSGNTVMHRGFIMSAGAFFVGLAMVNPLSGNMTSNVKRYTMNLGGVGALRYPVQVVTVPTNAGWQSATTMKCHFNVFSPRYRINFGGYAEKSSGITSKTKGFVGGILAIDSAVATRTSHTAMVATTPVQFTVAQRQR